MPRKKRKTAERGVRVSVNGRPTRFKIGDHIKFHEGDKLRCVTRLQVDADGGVVYLLTYMGEDGLESQWMSENEFMLMGSLIEQPTVIGFK